MTMHCLRAGEGAPPLVFVHGLACAHAGHFPQIEAAERVNSLLASLA